MKQHIILNFSSDYKIPEEIMKLSLREAEILVEAGLAEIKKNAFNTTQTPVEEKQQRELPATEETSDGRSAAFDTSYAKFSKKTHRYYEKQMEVMKEVYEMQIKSLETKLTKSNQLCDEQTRMIEKNLALIEMSLEIINRLTVRENNL